jgi:hypothetical protein
MKIRTLLWLVGVVIVLPGCSGGSSSSSTTTAPTATTTDVLTGTVAAPINGVLQSSYNPFSVAQSGGTVSVTLTSAVETLPGGALLTSVTMGLGIGTISTDTCTLLTNAFTTAQAGSAAQLTGNLNAGAYCVKVSDVSNQFGPVSYAVAVTHP